jgi:tRNA A-37 threonylcarbamoyl transferase component Bud32
VNTVDVLRHLERRLPRFEPTRDPEPLAGGYLNLVWRVPGRRRSVIVKHAPPYIVAHPEVPLDTHRMDIEARILRALAPGGTLAGVASPGVRPPHLLDYDEQDHVMVMEDVGECPDLGTWLHQWPRPECSQRDVGRLLGQFIGLLHVQSANDPRLAEAFDNASIQRTRLEVQYRAIGQLCHKAGLPDAVELGERAAAFGERLQGPGICVIMGDLWPPSVRVTGAGLRLIDWELAHFGRPSQDVGHLAAHLWMYAHRAPTEQAAAKAHAVFQQFLHAYRTALGERLERILSVGMVYECAIHMGSEILVRAVGSFQEGYLYEGLELNDRPIQEAIAVAAEHLRMPDDVNTFHPLSS